MHKLRENAEKELKMIEEKGLTASNLDNAYKLTEIIKGVDKIEMMKNDGGYSQARGRYSRDREDYSMDGMSRDAYSRDGYSRDDYDNGNSYYRGRNHRTGEYMHRSSRLSGDDMDMEKYREHKREYSQSRDDSSKRKMLNSLEDFAAGVTGMLRQILRDASCEEEREIIRKYARELVEM